jgi:ribosomal protein L37E
MENQVYQCSWKRVKGGYRLLLKNKPHLAVEAKTFEEAEDDLHGLVCGEFGDGESVFEFDPPPPVAIKTKAYFEPAMFVFNANDYIREANRQEGLYSDGYCSCCGAGLGGRTNKIRVLTSVPKYDVSFIWSAKPHVRFFSRKAASFIYRAGLPKTAFQKVSFSVKTKREYFELVARPQIQFVGVKNPPRPADGWECAKCGLKSFHPFHKAIAPSVFEFLARSDMERVSSNVFVVGGSYKHNICMSAAIAARLRRLSGLKGIITSRVALLNEAEVDRNPKVKVLKKGDFV